MSNIFQGLRDFFMRSFVWRSCRSGKEPLPPMLPVSNFARDEVMAYVVNAFSDKDEASLVIVVYSRNKDTLNEKVMAYMHGNFLGDEPNTIARAVKISFAKHDPLRKS